MKVIAASLIALGLGLGDVVGANAQIVPPNVPTMTIKIFNDDAKNYAFPVLTTGHHDADIWLQAIFKISKNKVDSGSFNYPSDLGYRIYINPQSGIAPGQNVVITVPLYTQLVETPNASQKNQYIDWWNGGTIQMFYSASNTPPPALRDDIANRPAQKLINLTGLPKGAVVPACMTNAGVPCGPSALQFYSDPADLPKADPAQLLEFTLGARVDLTPVNNPDTDPPNTLDLMNVDFDVSYVNVAYGPAAMGPYKNDQVGYVGTPQTIASFNTALNNFLTAKDFSGWPQFIRTFPDQPSPTTILKLPSPLEIFARMAGGGSAPPDLTPTPDPSKWPDVLWPPIQNLMNEWKWYAGAGTLPTGACSEDSGKNAFCNALVAVKHLMIANYNNYAKIGCGHPTIKLTDEVLIAHVYGWAPFTENGCGASQNNLENTPDTPTNYSDNNYARYVLVKQDFDKLNYGKFPDAHYTFNPWVELIHGAVYLNAPNVYAYSVDDAVGNIQAEGAGFIIDIGSTQNLENPLPATPPINIALGYGGPSPIQFASYRVCKNDPSRDKPINPHFASFVISANNPQNCPVYLLDNKTPQQYYTFTVTQPPPFTIFQNPADAQWSQTTAKIIDCSGNTGVGFYPSSKLWCCEKLAGASGNGVFAYSKPDPTNVHQFYENDVVTIKAEEQTTGGGTTCNMGQ